MNGLQASTASSAASRPLASAVFLGTDANGVSFVCDAGGLRGARQQAGAPVEVSPFINADQNNSIDPRLLSPADLQGIYEAVARAGASSSLAAQAMQLVQHVMAVDEARSLDSMRYEASLYSSETALSALQSHVATLPEMYATREKLQRERWQVEADQLHSQAQVLATKLVNGGRVAVNSMELPKTWQGTNDRVYAYYRPVEPPEIDTNIQLLKSDVRHLQRKLQAAETRASRMDEEVRRFRALVLRGSPLVAIDTEVALPSTSHLHSTSTGPAPPRQPRKDRLPLMGDAEAEHLLIAGKKLSHVRRIRRVPLSSAIVSQAEAIVANGGYALPLPPTPKPPIKRASAAARGSAQTPPHSPSKARQGSSTPLQTSSLGPAVAMSPGSAMSFLGINDLLHAAQSVSYPTRSTTVESPDAGAGPSGTKRRLSDVEEGGEDRKEGKQKQKDSPPSGQDVDRGDTDWCSALDVLADQAASQQAVPSASPSPTPPATSPPPPASAANEVQSEARTEV